MSNSKNNWYVLYTKPRWEKKVYSLLLERGIMAYCPVSRVKKQWSDRMKWVEEPLFKSYVFVLVPEDQLRLVRMVEGVVNFVYWLGKPAIVREKEIELIRKFLDEHDEVRAEPIDLAATEEVVIRRGAFMDKEATIIKVLNKKVRVIIKSIGYSLVAVIDRSNVSNSRK